MKTTEEMIEVMKAHTEGKPIEAKPNTCLAWTTLVSPSWEWGKCDYRIKKEVWEKEWDKTNCTPQTDLVKHGYELGFKRAIEIIQEQKNEKAGASIKE